MKIVKRIMAYMLSIAMLLGMGDFNVYAATAKTTESQISIENGKNYIVPLKFYSNLNIYKYEEELSGTIEDFMDNIAVVSLNQDGTYHVTLQIENYEKIDMLQIAKPGAIEDETKPADLPLGTYNIPNRYIYAYSNENFSDWTSYLKSQNLMSDEYNDKYIQNFSTEKTDTGVTWYSFNVDNLDKSLYVNSFYSYDNSTFKTSGKKSGKIFFDLSEIEEVKDYTQDNYSNVGLELAKVVRMLEALLRIGIKVKDKVEMIALETEQQELSQTRNCLLTQRFQELIQYECWKVLRTLVILPQKIHY